MSGRQSEDHSSATGAPIVREVAALLIRLGRPGMRLVTSTDGSVAVVGPGRAARPQPVAVPILQAARSAGLLTLSTATGHEVLSKQGNAALRQLLMSDAAPAPRPAVKSNTPERRADRLSLVEQLGVRRDAKGVPLLSEMQIAAAQRFTRDFATGGLQPRVTARWSAEASRDQSRRGAPGAGVELSEAVAAAQARARKALASLGGSLADVVMDVCCFERGLEAIEAARHWPSRSGRIVLGIALDALAAHYGMSGKATSQSSAKRHWAEPDFKPTTDAWIKR